MSESTKPAAPQFATAEYGDQSGVAVCKSCSQPLGNSHFRVNGIPTCAGCAEKIKARFPKDSHAAFVRGITFGVGGAILGLILYVAFTVATGVEIGFVSLAVGYIVGKAVIMGSGGRGGRRYQVAAVLLTYAAVSLAAVPISISMQAKEGHTHQQTAADTNQAPKPAASLGRAVGELALLGLASPFLELSNPAQGIIGLIILYVGLRIAWRLTVGRMVDIVGPVTEAPPAAAA